MDHYRKLERMYASAPINQYFAPNLVVGHRTAEVHITVRPDFHHSAGAMHGVVYFKALDDATFFAANSILDEHFVLTAQFQIEFLRPVSSGTVRAVAHVTETSERRITAIGELFDEDGTLVGRGTGQFAPSRIRLGADVLYV